MKATVKVMNSWNYHNYTIEIEKEVNSLHEIDDMRIEAQVLVDHAINERKKADEHEKRFNELKTQLSQVKYQYEIAKERHGKPRPKGWLDDSDDGGEQVYDLSLEIRQCESDIASLQFQIDNWKPFDYHEAETKMAEEAGCFDE